MSVFYKIPLKQLFCKKRESNFEKKLIFPM